MLASFGGGGGQAQAAADPLVNFAVRKRAIQSSTGFGGTAGRAVDGSTNGNFAANSVSHTGNEREAWWEVDLGQVQAIREIRVWNRTDEQGARLANFYVLISAEPFTSGRLGPVLGAPGVWSFLQRGIAGSPTVIPAPATGRYVRVQLRDANFLALAEVEVLGTASPAAAAPVAPRPPPAPPVARASPPKPATSPEGAAARRSEDARPEVADATIDLKGAVLVRRTVTPGTAPQRIETKEGVALVLPGGAVKEARDVTIAEVARPPVPAGEALAVMTAYDVRVGDQAVFGQPLTLELPYDPKLLRADLPAQKAITAAWWDAERSSWRVTPSVVDEINHKVVVKTQHLTVWSTLRWMKQWDILEAENFVLAYKRGYHPGLPPLTPQQRQTVQNWARKEGLPMDDPKVLKKIDAVRGGDEAVANSTAKSYTGLSEGDLAGLGLSGGWPAYARDPQLPPYVRDTAVLLNRAYERYREAGFRLPDPQLNVEVSPGWFSTSDARNTWTGIIGIGLSNISWQKLFNSAAHELFHAVQNQYYWDFGMGGSRLWWIEATAECAAGTVGTGLGIPRSLPPYYLQRSVTHVSSMFAGDKDPFGEHEYETGHLLNFIAQAAGGTPRSFRAYFELVVANDAARGTGAIFVPIEMATGQDVNLTLHALEVGTQRHTNRSLADAFRDFAAWMAFSEESACEVDPAMIAGGGAQALALRVPDNPEQYAGAVLHWRGELQPNYTGQVVRVGVSADATVQVRLTEALPPGTHADLYLLPGGARVAKVQRLGTLVDAATPVGAPLKVADQLYVVAINTTTQARRVAWSAGLAEVKRSATRIAGITPNPAKPGETIKIRGSNFGDGHFVDNKKRVFNLYNKVFVDGKSQTVLGWSDTEISVAVPSSQPAGSQVRVKVATQSEAISNEVTLSIAAAAPAKREILHKKTASSEYYYYRNAKGDEVKHGLEKRYCDKENIAAWDIGVAEGPRYPLGALMAEVNWVDGKPVSSRRIEPGATEPKP